MNAIHINAQASQIACKARRQNFYAFLCSAFRILVPGTVLVEANYLETLCFELQEVAEGRNRRLVVNMPPRYMKSVAAAVAWPAWLLGRNPSAQILVACYGDTLAREHSQMFRTLVQSELYRRIFPDTAVQDGAGRLHEFRTRQGGGRRAITLGGAVTGLGADYIIIDDLMKAADATSEAARNDARAFYDGTLISRLNNKRTGAVIAIQQRLHPDDLPAYLLEKDGYCHLNLPAIAIRDTAYRLYNGFEWTHKRGTALCPQREDLALLEHTRSDVGSAVFETQYQQDPTAGQATMVDSQRWCLLNGRPDSIRRLKTVQSWDTAIKDGPNCDFSVCATFAWDGIRWLLVDVLRERLDFENLKARALQQQHRWGADAVVVEDSANGSALVQDMRRNGFLEFIVLSVREAKTARFSPAAEWLHQGKIGILHECTWYPELRRELLSFPNGRHDDQVDAISLFVKKMRSRRLVKTETQAPSTALSHAAIEARQRMRKQYGAL